jgi:hypothetical protein
MHMNIRTFRIVYEILCEYSCALLYVSLSNSVACGDFCYVPLSEILRLLKIVRTKGCGQKCLYISVLHINKYRGMNKII